jgi:hypothetical protein
MLKAKPKCSDKFDDVREIGSGMICVVLGRTSDGDLKEVNMPITAEAYYRDSYYEFTNGIRYGVLYFNADKYSSIYHNCGLEDIGSVIDHMIMRARNGEYAHYKDYAPDGTMHHNYKDMPHRPKTDAATPKPNDPKGEKGLFLATSNASSNADKANQSTKPGRRAIL